MFRNTYRPYVTPAPTLEPHAESYPLAKFRCSLSLEKERAHRVLGYPAPGFVLPFEGFVLCGKKEDKQLFLVVNLGKGKNLVNFSCTSRQRGSGMLQSFERRFDLKCKNGFPQKHAERKTGGRNTQRAIQNSKKGTASRPLFQVVGSRRNSNAETGRKTGRVKGLHQSVTHHILPCNAVFSESAQRICGLRQTWFE